MTLLRDGLPWLMSAVTLTAIYFAGEKKPWAWLISLGNQALWGTWIYVTGAWGLAPMCLCLTVMYARNFQKWRAASSLDPRDFAAGRICPQDGGVCWGPCDGAACEALAAKET